MIHIDLALKSLTKLSEQSSGQGDGASEEDISFALRDHECVVGERVSVFYKEGWHFGTVTSVSQSGSVTVEFDTPVHTTKTWTGSYRKRFHWNQARKQEHRRIKGSSKSSW